RGEFPRRRGPNGPNQDRILEVERMRIGRNPPLHDQVIVVEAAGGDADRRKRQAQLTEFRLVSVKTNRQPRWRYVDVTWFACGREFLTEAESVGGHSETGMN